MTDRDCRRHLQAELTVDPLFRITVQRGIPSAATSAQLFLAFPIQLSLEELLERLRAATFTSGVRMVDAQITLGLVPHLSITVVLPPLLQESSSVLEALRQLIQSMSTPV